MLGHRLSRAAELRARARGVSMIEAMVTLAIAGMLLALAAPAFSNWIQGVRIRSTAEAMLAGVQFAKSEATARNTQVRFQLTDSLDSSCSLSPTGRNWVVDVVDAANDSVAGQCDAAPSDTAAPSILQVRSASDGVGTVTVNSSATAVVFNGLGRPVPQGAQQPQLIEIEINGPDASQCSAQGGDLTCLMIRITPAGQVRLCNNNLAAGAPQACE